MRFIAQYACGLLLISIYSWAGATGDGLGYSDGLSGDTPNNAVVLPQSPPVNVPNGVRPVIILPPESIQPHTLVVPLPGEEAPPVVLRRDSIQVVPNMQPALPSSKVPKSKQSDPNSKSNSKNKTGNSKPLDPIVY